MPAQRPQASPLKALRSSKSPGKAKKRRRNDDESDDEELELPRLSNRGPVHSISDSVTAKSVLDCIKHVRANMFEEIPRRAGMNSTRVAEVLNFRKSLPPIATVSHIYALKSSPTAAEREIATLVQQGIVRKLGIPGRGLGSTAIGEFVVSTESWIDSVNSSNQLTQELKGKPGEYSPSSRFEEILLILIDKYLLILHECPSSKTVPGSKFTSQEIIKLVQAGFLTSHSPAFSTRTTPSAVVSGQGALSRLATAGSRAPAGSIAAVGGEGAVHNAGGSGVAGHRSDNTSTHLSFSLPSVGLYLRLLASAREHLLTLLSKSRYREAPLDVLRERWNGGISLVDKPDRARGLQSLVLPGRTRKWRHYYGIAFQWMLEECFGSGAIGLFDTGSVGIGARVSQ